MTGLEPVRPNKNGRCPGLLVQGSARMISPVPFRQRARLHCWPIGWRRRSQLDDVLPARVSGCTTKFSGQPERAGSLAQSRP